MRDFFAITVLIALSVAVFSVFTVIDVSNNNDELLEAIQDNEREFQIGNTVYACRITQQLILNAER